jgi:hypothetical protein
LGNISTGKGKLDSWEINGSLLLEQSNYYRATPHQCQGLDFAPQRALAAFRQVLPIIIEKLKRVFTHRPKLVIMT